MNHRGRGRNTEKTISQFQTLMPRNQGFVFSVFLPLCSLRLCGSFNSSLAAVLDQKSQLLQLNRQIDRHDVYPGRLTQDARARNAVTGFRVSPAFAAIRLTPAAESDRRQDAQFDAQRRQQFRHFIGRMNLQSFDGVPDLAGSASKKPRYSEAAIRTLDAATPDPGCPLPPGPPTTRGLRPAPGGWRR